MRSPLGGKSRLLQNLCYTPAALRKKEKPRQDFGQKVFDMSSSFWPP
jgi:hypothetical protein